MENRFRRLALSLGAAIGTLTGVASAQESDMPKPETDGLKIEYSAEEEVKPFAERAGETVHQGTNFLLDTVSYLPLEIGGLAGDAVGGLFNVGGELFDYIGLDPVGSVFHSAGDVVKQAPVSVGTAVTGLKDATSKVLETATQATIEAGTGHLLKAAGTISEGAGDTVDALTTNTVNAVADMAHVGGNGISEFGEATGDDVVAPTLSSAVHGAANVTVGVTGNASDITEAALYAASNAANRMDVAGFNALEGNFTQAGREMAGVTTDVTQFAGNAVQHVGDAVADVMEDGLNFGTDALVNVSKPGVKALAEGAEMFAERAAEKNGVTKSGEDIRQLKEIINAGPEIVRDVGKTMNAGLADAVRLGGKTTDTMIKTTGMSVDAAVRGQSEEMVTNAMPGLEDTGNNIGAHLVQDTVQNAESIVSRVSKIKSADEAKDLAKRIRSEEKRIASQAQDNLRDLDRTLYNSNEQARDGEGVTILEYLVKNGIKVEETRTGDENKIAQLIKAVTDKTK
ncbi:MAG: hypothetical protein J6P93_02635 [Alphaproteobacteria bacterium]|nr:hypothetical protein [Alphaproteobacteria bacterium]